MPALYFRDDSFEAFFSADLRKLRELMPSDKLHPVPWLRPGRGLLFIGAYNYLESTPGAYGELAVVVPAVYGRRPPPLLPALLESRWRGFGGVVLHLPVNLRHARDVGRDWWGLAKFLASMQFQNTPEFHECRIDEGGRHVLTLRVMKRGFIMRNRQPVSIYSVKDGDLLRTTVQQSMLTRIGLGAGGSSLELDEIHPVARSIRALGINPRPLFTRCHLDRQVILPYGEVIERGVRPLDGYLGSDHEEGVLPIIHLPPPWPQSVPSVTLH